MITCKRPTYHIWSKLKATSTFLWQARKANQKCLKTLKALTGEHNKSMVPRVLQINTKNETFPLNQNLTRANCGAVFMMRVV